MKELTLLNDYSNLHTLIIKRIEEGFSYKELESMYNKLYKIKQKLTNISKEYLCIL